MDKRYEIGFIGSGNMCKAMVSGIFKAKLYNMDKIIVCDIDENKLKDFNEIYGVNITTDVEKLAKTSNIIILTVKPNHYSIILENIKYVLDNQNLIITVAAGKTIKSVEDILGQNTKIVRTMPNTPALVNQGMSGICPNKNVSDKEVLKIKEIFESFGKVEIILEELMDAVIGISGSAPAYVFMFIEAMADAGVVHGLSREKAYKFAAQTVLGSAQMVLETGKHPGELKDMVCSPGGSTIEAVSILEKMGFRGAVIGGVNACVEKAKNMSKEIK